MNIIRICIRAISRVQIYSDICSVNMWYPNIFGYYVASEYIWLFVRVHFMIFTYHCTALTCRGDSLVSDSFARSQNQCRGSVYEEEMSQKKMK